MQLRQNNIQKLAQDTYDVLIIGGGINGAVWPPRFPARACYCLDR